MPRPPLFFLFSVPYTLTIAVTVGFMDMEGDNPITKIGEGTYVVAGSEGVDKTAEGKADVSTRVKRAADYQVPEVSIRQNGESRIVTWMEASGPLPVTKYNIYRTFTTDVPFDVTLLKPISTINISSTQPSPFKWRDVCRTEAASVRYAITAVDSSDREHRSDAVPSNLLPLVDSFVFVSATEIKYPMHTVGHCCVMHHCLVFNPDLSQFLLVYDCDEDNDGNGDNIFVVFLDSFGNITHPARSIRAATFGHSLQERPLAVYNRKLKQYLVAFHLRNYILNWNRQIIISRVIQAEPTIRIDPPRLSLLGSDPYGQPAHLRRGSLIYNPVTNGYVVSAELILSSSVQIVFAHLDASGLAAPSGINYVFELTQTDVVQPNLIYDPTTEAIIFVSQLDKSHRSLNGTGKHGVILKSVPASANSAAGRRTRVIGFTGVLNSSISIHRENVSGCFGVFFLIDEYNTGMTETTCSKVCYIGQDDWGVSDNDVRFCNCKEKVVNPHIIEYPGNGSVFGVWEETNQAGHLLHGHYMSTQEFLQNPLAVIQKHPLAVYKSNDGQVCVVWQHLTSGSTCGKLAFRCFEVSPRCNDQCCCSLGDHCDACGFQICDRNAECTAETQCRCRSALGYSGDGASCHFDPCTPGYHNCTHDVDCMARDKSFVCDPCAFGAQVCHHHATCNPTLDGTFICICNQGYIGNGYICLDPTICPSNAETVHGACECSRGFVGNGAFCCPKNFGDKDAVLGSNITLQFDTACLDVFLRFSPSFQWYHNGFALLINASSYTSYRSENSTTLVIENIEKGHLGQYILRFSVGVYGPYEVKARVDLLQTGGRCTCGHSGRHDPRISAEGVEAKPGEFPWQAMLCGTNGRVFCGGVMISKCCILTAAHCVIGAPAERNFNTSNSSSLTVCLGRTSGSCDDGIYKNKEQENERVQCFRAHRILVHQGYIESTFEHDIAMIQLNCSNCLKCRAASVRPVCLPKAKRDKTYIRLGTKAWVIGWGKIQNKRKTSGTLRKGKTKLVSHGKCKDFFEQISNPAVVTEDQVCAKDDVGPCEGDSGGPLMARNPEFDNRYILVGLVSWGQGCGRKGSYGVYTDVEHHLDWIYDSCCRWN